MRQSKKILAAGLMIWIAAFAVPVHASTVWSWELFRRRHHGEWHI